MDRSCGSCTQCCKILSVEEIEKPRYEWCKHCDPKSGCKIYETRPKSCVEFSCLWLQGFGDDWFKPNRSKIVATGDSNGLNVVLHLDPNYPLAYKETRVQSLIYRLNNQSIKVIIVNGDKRTMLC